MFSNGSEYDCFQDYFCCRCKRYVPGSVVGEGCPIEESMSLCSITGDEEDFPFDKLIECGRRCRYICKEFQGETEELQAQFEEVLREQGDR